MCEGFPKNKFALAFFLAAFTVVAVVFAGVAVVTMGVGKEEDADSCYQGQEQNPYVVLRFHDSQFALLDKSRH